MEQNNVEPSKVSNYKGNLISTLFLILIVTLLYTGTAFLGKFFALPPGYATAIWIPSGIALGAALVWGLRIIPGVFLGSLIFNFFIATHYGTEIALYQPLEIGAIIASGATLQVIVGWLLIKKWLGLSNSLTRPNDILLFALLSGPVSCLVNTTWSNTALLFLNAIPINSYWLSWGTWWIGDSIGVLIVTPLFLILFAQPKEIWRPRILPILLPLFASFVVVTFAYFVIYSSEFKHIQSNFEQTVSNSLMQLQNQLENENRFKNLNELITQDFNNLNNFYSMQFIDITNPNNTQILYSVTHDQLKPSNESYFVIHKSINIHNKLISFSAIPSIIYFTNEFTWQIPLVLMSGLLFCVLINIILFIVYGQKHLAQIGMNEKSFALEKEESKNLLILRSAGEGIYGIDNNGFVTFMNPAAAKMLGYSESELIGKHLHDIIHYRYSDGSDYPEDKCPIYEACKKNKVYRIADEVFWRKNGSSFWVEYTVTPMKEEKGLTGAVVVFSDITEHHEIEANLQKLARFDVLTSLPNRVSFFEHLTYAVEEAKERNHILAICFIDVDNFKEINDSLGHRIGDETLKILAKLLKPGLRSEDYFSRLGGDEFGMILKDVKSEEDIKNILNRFLKVIENPIKIGDFEINISISIGIATYPIAGKEPEELIMNADIAMYHAKELGKNTYAFFDEQINKKIKRRNQLDMKMQHALANKEFSVDYQLQIKAKTMQILGVESLLRWHSKELGLVLPSEFIPVAETNGLIHQIGEWVLRQACLDFNKIKAFYSEKLLLSINVSVMQLEHTNFINELQNILNETQMECSNLVLEITESSLIHNPEHLLRVMAQIKKLGIRFALDDFGVSYSSMQYLKNLPVSLIKIDQGFVRDMTKNSSDAKIVNATIQLCHAMGIKTIAEGIENEEQFKMLKKMGCEYMQGFYFAKPLPFVELLNHPLFKTLVS